MGTLSSPTAKITKPLPTGIIHRDRLYKLLDCRKTRPVVWVSGPAGSGKTTLVSGYIDSIKVTNIWYQMDSSDRDVASFFHQMGLAVRIASPRSRFRLPVFTPEYLMGLPAFTKQYFQELSRRLKPPFVIVLDNYQDVDLDSPLHELLSNAILELPNGCSIVVMSRTEPPSTMARLRVNSHMGCIDWTDLKLDMKECNAIARQRVGSVSNKACNGLHKITQGWVGGLVLLLEQGNPQSIKGKRLSEDFGAEEVPEVFDYFANEVFSNTIHETQDFLLKSTFLKSMTPQTAGRITGSKKAASILSTLKRKGYFIEKRPGTVYQYHQLFREFLLDKAERTFKDKDIASLRRTAAGIHEENGEIDAAAELLSKAEDWQGLSMLILGNAMILLSQGRGGMLLEWLRSLPEDVLNANPWLLYWFGTAGMPYGPEGSLPCFEKSYASFLRLKDPTGMYLSCAGAMLAITTSFSNFTRTDLWMKRLERLVKKCPFPSEEIEMQVANAILFAQLYRNPAYRDIEEWAERAYELSQKSRNQSIRIYVGVNLSVYYLLTGDFTKCVKMYKMHKTDKWSPEVMPLAMIFEKIVGCWLSWNVFEPELSYSLVREALDLSEMSGLHIADSLLLGSGATYALLQEDEEKASEYLSLMKPTTQFDKGFYYFLASWHQMLRGNIPLAIEYAKTAIKNTNQLGGPNQECTSRHALTQIYLEAKDTKSAETSLAEGKRLALKSRSLILKFHNLISEAQLALDKGEEAKTVRVLRQAFVLAREEGYLNLYCWRNSIMARLCSKALDYGIEVEYVRALIKKRSIMPDGLEVLSDKWPWPIRVYTLGPYSLAIDGKPVHFSVNGQKKPMDMLKALIALGGVEISEETISDTLWPDSDGDKAHQSFAVTLNRLRKLMGNDKAVILKQGLLSIDPRYCWVDVWAFERIAGKAKILLENGETSNALPLIEKLAKLYCGDFFSNDSMSSIVISKRERLRNRFIDGLDKLGEALEGSGDYRKSIKFYKRALDVDDLAEEFYTRIMSCHLRLGQKAAALAVYSRLKRVLSIKLGIEPSAATVAVYRKIVS